MGHHLATVLDRDLELVVLEEDPVSEDYAKSEFV
jgi:hypothetical protein